MTLATGQLVVGVAYAVFLWVAPDARKAPKITVSDFITMIPAGVCTAGAHAASVFSLAAGGVAFGQIVKAAEPAFAAVVGTFVYGKKISVAKIKALMTLSQQKKCLRELSPQIFVIFNRFGESLPPRKFSRKHTTIHQ